MDGRIGVQKWKCERCHAVELYYRLPPEWKKTPTGVVCESCIRLKRQAGYRAKSGAVSLIDEREPRDMKAAVLRFMRRGRPVPTKVIAKKLNAKLPGIQALLSEMRNDGLVKLVPKKYYVLSSQLSAVSYQD